MSGSSSSITSLFADSARSFVSRNYSFNRRNQRLTEDGGAGSPLWREFAELGWLACLISEDHGGLAARAGDMAALMEQCGRALLVEPLLSSAVLATKLLDTAGGDRAAQVLDRLADGTIQAAVAYAEEGTRTNIENVAATAAATDGGFVLNGHKRAVLGGPTASTLIVSARTDLEGRAAFVLLCVDATAQGVGMTSYQTIDGHAAADVTLHNVAVEGSSLLGGAGDGPAILSLALDWAAIAACAQLVGAIDETIRISAEYAKTRQQFGRPIGQFQSIKHLLADMAAQALLARAMLSRAVDALDDDDDRITREKIVSAAKNSIARAAHFVTSNGIQIHGGIGMTDEYIVGHYYKRALVLSELFGSATFHVDRFSSLSRAQRTASLECGMTHAV